MKNCFIKIMSCFLLVLIICTVLCETEWISADDSEVSQIDVEGEETQMSEAFKAILNKDGKFVIPSVEPKNEEEVLMYVNEYVWQLYNKKGISANYTTYNSETKTCDVSLKGEKHNVEILFEYDKEINKEAQNVIAKFPKNVDQFYVKDMELIQYWLSQPANGKEIDNLHTFSSGIKALTENTKFTFFIDNLGGDNEEYATFKVGMGWMIYDGVAYYTKEMIDTDAPHIMYIPADAESSKEELVKVVQDRVDEHVGKGKVKIAFGGSGVNQIYKDEYNSSKRMSFLTEAVGDYWFIATVNNVDHKFIVVKNDSITVEKDDGGVPDTETTEDKKPAGGTESTKDTETADDMKHTNDTESANDTGTTEDKKPTEDTESTEASSEKEVYVVELDVEKKVISKEDFDFIIQKNREQDVVIKSNESVIFTFKKGSMIEIENVKEYDFGTVIETNYKEIAEFGKWINEKNFVMHVNYKYSGKLPGMASIKITVGKDKAGSTLFYSKICEDGTISFICSAVVDENGIITVNQDSCSDYILTTEKIDSKTDSDNVDTQIDNEKETTSNVGGIIVAVIIIIAIIGVIVLVVLKKKNIIKI